MFDITYHPSVVAEDIPNLSGVWNKKIRVAIEKRLTTKPDLYGKPLRRSLEGYRKFRVGDYRVVFRVRDNTVIILVIQHRSVVYTKAVKRT
ncbi:MAG: Toxin-antitoxin system, toxin component, RelE family [Candidatus Roizmanbacteria bacterium GW2011_GWA1_41_13]|uniref:Toxin-antitoxin system, toxin component, RelE family n=1 Tax=Candidatus Roizmanbacteria bacterium GW2011_GWA1_41_13 TaxID=1618474 RepID=A0A0G0UR07_9BACT|nr:MAG: Toxin-antitoxin system, toxin component, RelE family [Candidatus Roizmanbacteria bacterium GW2011_GWA1_41_13]